MTLTRDVAILARIRQSVDRPLDGGPYCYLWLDSLTQRVREEGRILSVSVAVAHRGGL